MLVLHFLVAFIFLAYYAIWGWLLGNYIGLVYRVCQDVHYRCAVATRLGAHFTFREIFSLVTTALGQEWSRFVDSDPIMGFLNNGQGLVLNRVGYSVVDNLRWYLFANFPFLFEMVAQPIVRAFSPTPLPKPQHTHFVFQTDEKPSVYIPRSRKNSYENLPAWLAQELDCASDKVSPTTLKKLVNRCIRKNKYKDFQFKLQTDWEITAEERAALNSQFPAVEFEYNYQPEDEFSSDDEDSSFSLGSSGFSFSSNERHVTTYWGRVSNVFESTIVPAGQRLLGLAKPEVNFCLKLVEDCALLARLLIKARDMEDRILAVTAFAKLQTNKALSLEVGEQLLSFLGVIFKDQSQLTVQTEDVVKLSRNLLNKYDEVRDSKLWKKVHRFLMYAISMSLFSKAGITMDNLKYTKMEQEALKKKFHMGPDFVRTCLDTALFICERGQQVYETGSIDSLFHSGEEYSKWFEKALELKRNSLLMSNPTAHGLNVYSYLSDLGDCIEKGAAIVKHAQRLKHHDVRLFGKIHEDLKLIHAEFIGKREAMQERRAPFSVLVAGDTSINKSGLTNLLFKHYGKLFNLDTSSEFKYTRNSIDKFWVNFNSYQWCVQLDDIAFLLPEKAQQGDPTLLEMLQVVNNVPFVPIQAALEDKGRTPLMSRLVIASTNTIHLNAKAYFSCPGAIQRRFPWVLDVKVKDEFKRADGRFDTAVASAYSKELPEGHYPNFWIINVKEVKVASDGNRQCGVLEDYETFDDIYKFIQWFSVEAMKYELTQDSAMEVNRKMEAGGLCSFCKEDGLYTPCWSRGCCNIDKPTLKPIEKKLITQSGTGPELTAFRPNVYRRLWAGAKGHIEREAKAIVAEKVKEERLRSTPMLLTLLFWWFYVHLFFFRWLIDCLFGRDFAYSKVKHCVWNEGFGRRYIRRLGHSVQKQIGTKSFLLKVAAGITAGIILKKTYDYFTMNMSFKAPEEEKKAPIKPKTPSPRKYVAQGKVQSVMDIGQKPKAFGDEKPNPWYKEEYETTSFEVSPKSRSWKALPDEQIRRLLLKNIAAFSTIKVGDDTQTERSPVRGICLGGKVWITNNHAICDDPEFDLRVRCDGQENGIGDHITLRLTQDCVRRFPALDLAVLTLRGLPARSNICQYFGQNIGGVHEGYYIGRDFHGNPYIVDVERMRISQEILFKSDRTPYLSPDGSPRIFTLWKGHPSRATERGDCGLLMVSKTPMGPVLLGIHNAGYKDECTAAPIHRDFAELLVRECQPYEVQDGEPMLSAPSAPHELGPLHRKSPFRFIPEGTARVFGSLNAHQAEMKSRVRPTLLCEALQKRGYSLKYGKPVMNGWEPKHVQLKEMLKPASRLNPSLLDRVKEDFINDILSGLSPEDFDSLHPYDVFTAVNGAEGVAFVDKIKRNTSAGFPWKRNKKWFFEKIPPAHGLQDPIEFSSEIMERVEKIIEAYREGKRACPISDACFKDEPVKQAKIDAKKTRIFAGSPVDHSIVVRMFTLAFTRLFYKRHVLFEAAPGVDATSPEWGILYKILTKHGKDRMAAGDYAFYDKSMFSLMILAAFDIIIAVCSKGKFSLDDLKILHGIAEDAAFPWYNFFGDLVEFLGTLPSGHPLTVILNSLANSLYMRYCYASVSPNGSAKDFKKYVSLMTYGDDNIMGISPECPWFNHTVIQNVLASVGITYTMADKEEVSRPYIHIDECTFLKRSWRWDPDLQDFTAPLPEDSIIKMLMIGVESKSITRKEAAITVIGDAVRAYFHFGREVFEVKKRMLRQLVEECELGLYVEEHTFPTWAELADSFDRKREGAADYWC